MKQPSRPGPTITKYVVARTGDVPDGSRLVVDVGGREIGVFKVKGEYFALLNRCPHLGGPLCKGQLLNTVTSSGPGDMGLDQDDDLITCPWHGWEFDLRTGQSYWDPKGFKARRFPVGVEAGSVLAVQLENAGGQRFPGPYQAETIPVTVEDDYVVVQMRAPRPASQPSADPSGTERDGS
jgi:nitrite reductase/ring-hydroxylating ferredoxin subunit